jgi:uncharacterized membrane protein
MASEAMGAPESTSDDRLWAALAYVFTPLVPIILLLWEEKKNRPFIKAHNMQALVWGVAIFLIFTVLSITVILAICALPLALLAFLVDLYWAYQAYSGKLVNIPVVSNLVKNQGWA